MMIDCLRYQVATTTTTVTKRLIAHERQLGLGRSQPMLKLTRPLIDSRYQNRDATLYYNEPNGFPLLVNKLHCSNRLDEFLRR